MNITLLLHNMYKQCDGKLELDDLFQEIEDLNNMYYEHRKGEIENNE